MAVDLYAPCPCGSGKKLKFCCSDLVAEIEKVQGMIAGGQPHAALKHLDLLLSKQPERVSLLELKATLELSLEAFDAARNTIDVLLRVHPENATSHAHQAILAAATQDGLTAVSHLQDALQRVDNDMPQRVFEALGAVGQALLVEGDLIAARGHLLMYAGLAPEGDNRALELLLRMNLQSGLPLLMRDQQVLVELSQEDSGEPTPWRPEFEEASRLARRGLWRRAEGLFSKILEQSGPQPAIVYNLALVRGWLGKASQFADGLHEFARLDIPRDDAAEAEALAQLVDPNIEEPQLETVRLAFEISDAEALAEQFSIDRQVDNYQMQEDPQDRVGQDGTGQEGKSARPRHTYLLLNRPLPTTGVDLRREEVPHVIGFLAIYSKRTDCEARLEITTDRGARLDKVKEILSPLVPAGLGDRFPDHPEEEEVVAHKSLGEDSLSWRWRLPDDTPAEHRRKLLVQQRRTAILDGWTATARAALGGMSPLEACAEPAFQISLLASVLLVEQAIADPEEQSLLDDLREKLKLPARDTIDPAGIDIQRIPLVRVPRLNVASIPDDHLAQLLDRAVMVGAAIAVLTVATELVGRETVAEDVDQAVAYRQLIRVTANPRQALQWVQRARSWSRQHGKSEAEWAVQELELHLEQGDGTRMQQVITEIRDQHLNTPGVAESVHNLLQSAGLLPADGAGQQATGSRPNVHSASGPPGPKSPPVPDGKRPAIWTPGQNPPAPHGTEMGDQGGKKPAIWTP
jgi:tetratricopeptide (TPR) repeat protein